MTNALNYVVSIWSILGMLVMATMDYRKRLPKLN
jgi:hypothetical protein